MRIVQQGVLRSWSLLKAPPLRPGERRLAVERESFPVEAIRGHVFDEEAFGHGRVFVWDEGGVEVKVLLPRRLLIVFAGTKVIGTYELRKMIWYPGNRWLLTKLRTYELAPDSKD